MALAHPRDQVFGAAYVGSAHSLVHSMSMSSFSKELQPVTRLPVLDI